MTGGAFGSLKSDSTSNIRYVEFQLTSTRKRAMSENETSTTEVSTGPTDEPVLVEPRSDQDWFLQELVRYTNQWGISVDITLNLGGAMVSGKLISGETYLDEVAAEFKEGFKGNALGQTFFDLITSYKPVVRDPEDTTPLPPAHYIHLKDVRTYVPGRADQSVSSKLWRGRISKVSGFFLGEPGKSDS